MARPARPERSRSARSSRQLSRFYHSINLDRVFGTHRVARQITEAFPWDDAPRFMIRDRDRIYGTVVTRRLRAMGIRDKPTAPASPWQNGFAERLIGSIRRECLDQVVIFGETHLRRILSAYAAYYNKARTHLALQKDAPLHRAVQRSGGHCRHSDLGWAASPI